MGQIDCAMNRTKKRIKWSSATSVTDGSPWTYPLHRKKDLLCIKCVLRPSTNNQQSLTSKMGKQSTAGNNDRIQELRSLQVEAEKSVKPLMRHSQNVPSIIDRQEESFGRPELVNRDPVKDVLK
uniref:Uncharacterized protein n=1 Tax=Anopheles quadriannulatus TaxID=34691 RepID=A0A182XQ32_ANOQN